MKTSFTTTLVWIAFILFAPIIVTLIVIAIGLLADAIAHWRERHELSQC